LVLLLLRREEHQARGQRRADPHAIDEVKVTARGGPAVADAIRRAPGRAAK
jgi:hypothetical protein